jgi:hypothetical protein
MEVLLSCEHHMSCHLETVPVHLMCASGLAGFANWLRTCTFGNSFLSCSTLATCPGNLSAGSAMWSRIQIIVIVRKIRPNQASKHLSILATGRSYADANYPSYRLSTPQHPCISTTSVYQASIGPASPRRTCSLCSEQWESILALSCR